MPVAVCAVTQSGQWSFCSPLLHDFPGKQCITPVKRALIKKFRAINDNEKPRHSQDEPSRRAEGVSLPPGQMFFIGF
jgi:hypothetical protein